MGFGRDVLAAFAGHGDRVAMVSGRDQITYAQALIQIDHLTANFSALGIRSGDRVGLATIGNIDVVLSTLACWKLGATVSIWQCQPVRTAGRPIWRGKRRMWTPCAECLRPMPPVLIYAPSRPAPECR
ncbi:AMP-binding protein [Mesorhizobium caraganae]|uniref:AMP-binding protein n=1 Tax=Mesorhizobium caraganae TaxID=483206 RepID=UPI001939C634|nr:AMP-binding protein [Mesorhizobium caraganae]MBM2710328.1 AMP-binding protein [Mesorhizobium caraganae]